jgi:DUF2924 family protein
MWYGHVVETSMLMPDSPALFRALGGGGARVARHQLEVWMETTSTKPHRTTANPSTGGENKCTPHHLELSQKIAALNDLTAPQLRDEWRRLYRSQPPRLSRDLLVRTVAFRMQELAYGGLSKATQRKLLALTEELQSNGSVACDPVPQIRLGARLVREWRGRTHTVVVTEGGFEYAGKTYSSLSQIAQAITGAHWSGPRFFGLNRSEVSVAQGDLSPGDTSGEREDSNG